MKKKFNKSVLEQSFKDNLHIQLHLPEGYWREKIQSTNQIQKQLERLNRVIIRMNKDITANLFFEIKKHFKNYKFIYKLKLEGVDGNKFFTEKISGNYIKPLGDAVNQSINFLMRHNAKKR